MSYGLKIIAKTGSIVMTSSDIVSRMRWGTLCYPGTTSSKILSDIAGKQTFILAQRNRKALTYLGHKITREAGTIIMTAQSDSWYLSDFTEVMVFLYT